MTLNRSSILKQALIHGASILFFLVITCFFYAPSVLENKTLPQHDTKQFQASSQDLRAYYNNEGETSEWTGGMFSGMPSYQIGIWGGSPNVLKYIETPFQVLGHSTAGPMFAGLVCTYIMLILLGFRYPYALFGALAYAFSSYNIIIIAAGHVTKAWAIAYLPLVVGAMLALFRDKYLLSGVCLAIGLGLQIKSNHLQVTYYTAILCLILFIAFVIHKIRQKSLKDLLPSISYLFIAVLLAILANLSGFYANYEMSKTSTRGKSELTESTDSNTKESHGLDKEYVFNWSYGKGETLTLMIPNLYGGASTPLDENSRFFKEVISLYKTNKIDEQSAQQLLMGFGKYWGDQPGTSGPVYFGAIIVFLFILSLFVIRSRFKWVLAGSTLLFFTLAWGSNLSSINDLVYDYFPLYSKFRAVSQALIIPSFLVVFLATWGLKEFFDREDKKALLKPLYISGGITMGLSLLLWLTPSTFFNFLSTRELEYIKNLPKEIVNAITIDRETLLTSDAIRSFGFILITFILLFFITKKTDKTLKQKHLKTGVTLALAFFVLIDLWGIDRRYLSSDKFVDESTQSFPKSVADNAILQDKSISYRVLNLNDPFNDTSTSYYHRSVGGYHAAKLKRYQQLIERYLSPELQSIYQSFRTNDVDSIVGNFKNLPVINMLDTKYLIYAPNEPALQNPYALGNAWFVDEIKWVKSPDEEIASLGNTNLKDVAIIDESKYASRLNKNLNLAKDSLATIELVTYKPNVLTYKTKSAKDQLAVFSEIYYPNGWNAYLDDKKVDHIGADFVLRAMLVPAGEHTITFKFEPSAYRISKTIETIFSTFLVLLFIAFIVANLRKAIKD